MHKTIENALSHLPAAMSSREARVLLWAIGLQESELTFRRQHGNGPARGLWQFERSGGVAGVLSHHATRLLARRACERAGVEPSPFAVWEALETNDELAATFARLLLWTDPRPLPAIGDVEGAWALYLRTWRPGAHARGNEAQRAALRVKWGLHYGVALKEYPND